MQYDFVELIDLSGFQQMMEAWHSVTGVATALLDTERRCLCAVGWQDLCTRFHGLPPQTPGRCSHSDDYLFSHLREQAYVAHPCAQGLMNAAMPVMVKGEHVATLFAGQFLHAPPDEALFRQQAQASGSDADTYLAALQHLPVISEERLRVIMTAQTRLAEVLATLGWEHKQLLGASATYNQQAGQVAVLEERQRLARELHDSVVQSLYSMALYADAAALALAAGRQDVTVHHLSEVRDTARSAMYDMRLLIFELHPPSLEEEGLVTALRIRLAAVEARAGVHAELVVHGERRLPIEIEQELYRIAQEALNNIMKHAGAQRVRLQLDFTDGVLNLSVHDDGAGFDPLSVRAGGGMGLRSFEARAAKMGGRVTVASQPGQGTTVTVTVALQNEEAG